MKGDFQNKNTFKSHLQTSMKLDTLDALMQVALCMIFKLSTIKTQLTKPNNRDMG